MKVNRCHLFILLILVVMINSSQGTAKSGFPYESASIASPSVVNPYWLKYTPDRSLVTKDNILYLLSRDNLSIFRWSIPQRRYLSTIPLHDAPADIIYSPETNRLYLNYFPFPQYQVDPHITYIDLNQNPPLERPFIDQDSSVDKLVPIGSYIFMMDFTYHTTYSQDGEIISQIVRDGFYNSLVWNPINRRMYLFDQYHVPNKIFWETIHQDGMIDPGTEIITITDYQIEAPVFIKPDGSHMFFINGKVIDTETYSEIADLHFLTYNIDTTWKNNYFYTLTPHIEGSELTKREAQFYKFEASTLLEGTPIRLLPVSEGLLVITNLRGRPWFYILNEQLEIIYETFYYYNHIPLVSKDHCNGFIDSFSFPFSGWTIEDDEFVRTEYLDGEFRILTKDDRYLYTYAAPSCSAPEHINYSVDVDARWVGEPGFAYGIVYQISPDYDQYNLLLVNTDYQEFSIYKYSSESFTQLIAPEYTPAIKPGNEKNHMKIFQYASSSTYVEINDSVVGYVYSELEGPAYVGLVSVPYDGFPNSDARFDNFALTFSPPDTYGATVTSETCRKDTPKIELKDLFNPDSIERNKP